MNGNAEGRDDVLRYVQAARAAYILCNVWVNSVSVAASRRANESHLRVIG